MQAQATFKNMIGSLGDLSNETSYALSEAITQMALDYSSLYNVQLQSAVEKFQSALAGQVRPIRSISGYDITEKTIHALYQSLGGTKTQRQLSRTEKQLLAILAIFKQMEASGALGDMGKTLNMFANQSRMMTENLIELKSWTGMLVVDLLESWGIMVKINALLITITEVVKRIAQSRGVGDETFIDGIFESAQDANGEVEKLEGKLLGFDKFRSLGGMGSEEDVSIDRVLTEAIANYTSVMQNATNEAQNLAQEWLKWWFNDDNSLTQKARAFLELLNVIASVLLALGGVSVIGAIKKLSVVLGITGSSMTMIIASFGALIWGIAKFISAFDQLSDSAKVWIPVVWGLVGALTALATGLYILKGNWVAAISAGALIAGVGIAFSTQASIPNYEKGASDIDSGTVFRAGEFGKTEAVYTGSNGKTNVANVRQMEQAFYNALSRHSKDGNGNIVVQAYIDGEQVYQSTTAQAKRRGQVWSKA